MLEFSSGLKQRVRETLSEFGFVGLPASRSAHGGSRDQAEKPGGQGAGCDADPALACICSAVMDGGISKAWTT